jgi:hypothetical protein
MDRFRGVERERQRDRENKLKERKKRWKET